MTTAKEVTMRRVRYGVGMSLDVFIADIGGGTSFLTMDPAYDSRPFFESIDTALMGRHTYEAGVRQDVRRMPGVQNYVISTTLQGSACPEVTLIPGDIVSAIGDLRAAEGKDIWLVGGGVLFRSLAEAELVDTVEVGISPVLIGQGVSLAPPPLGRALRLTLTHSQVFSSGLVTLSYVIQRSKRRLH